jgi:S-adenosylmethionine:tRNA ribosyltransferase-isomerase
MVLLSDYDYHLPEELIAQSPLSERDSSRLLHLHRTSGKVEHRMFADTPEILQPGDVIVMNNTRVNAWRFYGNRPTGGQIEILALKEVEPSVFEVMLKPAKRLKVGDEIIVNQNLKAEVIERGEDAIQIVKFHSTTDLYAEMSRAGEVPLPPYITHKLQDPERYQTVVAQVAGSAAAPTAGLHFTPRVLDRLREQRVKIAEITLHVGIDTFRPIQVDDVTHHQMHGEICEIRPEAAAVINARKGRLIAVGTTAVRTLESFAMTGRKVADGRMESRLFIRPGIEFQVVDGMFTNFHMPKTTMLLMISSLSSREKILEAYRQAVEAKYRFLSFGDSMLILD